MKNQKVFVPHVGSGMCIEHVAHKCLVDFNGRLAWFDEGEVSPLGKEIRQ
jgi:hypothetical protein